MYEDRDNPTEWEKYIKARQKGVIGVSDYKKNCVKGKIPRRLMIEPKKRSNPDTNPRIYVYIDGKYAYSTRGYRTCREVTKEYNKANKTHKMTAHKSKQ